MTAQPLAISDLYDLVGYLDESIRGMTASQARIVLVGGSAFMYHFPNAHASFDADMCLVAPVSGAKIQLTQAVEALGFYPQGKRFGYGPKTHCCYLWDLSGFRSP